MGLRKDVATAKRLIRNILRSRRMRSRVAERLRAKGRPAPGTVSIAVYFSDPSVNLYQIRQWYAPLLKLAEKYPVAIISRAPSAVLALWEESPLPVVYARRVSDLESFVREQRLKIVFYVNQNTKNFQMFRYGRMWHVFINHGESDKMYMTTNQFKAYDYSLIAGDAARERLSKALWNFDLDSRTIAIGRPQADHFAGPVPYPRDDRTVVLYAPTWEGDRASAAYGSIASHGVAITSALLGTGQHRLIYRPHPRSGVVDAGYRAAHESIVADIAAANAADPTAHHVYDTGNDLGWQLVAADVAITDISAMIYDRLATGKPLIVTRPAAPTAHVDEAGYLAVCEWLEASAAPDVVNAVERARGDSDAKHNLEFWVHRHFGDTAPGAATARFHAAVDRLIAEWEKHAVLHAGEPIPDDDGADTDDASELVGDDAVDDLPDED